MEWMKFIRDYHPENEAETAEKESFLQFAEAFGNSAFDRENLVGHFCSSAWIVNKERTKALMIFHNMYKNWAWAGGHADGDKDLLHVALKEAREETGLKSIKQVFDNPIDLNVLVVHSHYKRGRFVPMHLHYNPVYLLEADENEPIRIKEDENSGVAWLEFDKINDYVSNEYTKVYYNRIMEKIKKFGW